MSACGGLLPDFGPGRVRQLHALGLQALVLRGRLMASAGTAPAGRAEAAPLPGAATAGGVRLRLWFAPDGAPQGAGETRLLHALLRALGLTPEEAEARPEAAGLPQLAFAGASVQVPDGAIRLPPLARLHDPLEKRIAWGCLRQLRRQLREGRQ